MQDYDRTLGSIFEQLKGFFDPSRYQQSVDSAVGAQENQARTDTQQRVKENLASRGIDPNSAFGQTMFQQMWAPMQGQFASARAGAGSDYYRMILGLAPTLLALTRKGGSSEGGGGYTAPPGMGIGSITNPEDLNRWDHLPSGGWNDVAVGGGGWDAGIGPNGRLEMYLNQRGRR
jgi:hypothetical protein